MANALVVGMLIAQRRPGRRPFLVGFEKFGAMALAFFIILATFFLREVVLPYLTPFVAPIERFIGPGRPIVYIPIGSLGLCGHARWVASVFRLRWWCTLP
jgi:hypothetical protein